MKMKTFLIVLKGFIVGATMLVPGVSGGSMAMILGIYDELIHCVNSFVKKKSMITLFLFCMGGISGVILFSYPMLYVLEHCYIYVMFFFLGCVISSISFIKRKAEIKHFQIKDYFYMSIGVIVVTLVTYIPVTIINANIFVYILSGFMLAVALVLPGISVSYVMVILGIYENVILMIQHFDIVGLLPIIIGGIVGIFVISSLIEYLLNRYKETTYMMIFGFVLGSIVEIFPGLPQSPQILICLLLFGLGYMIIHYLSLMEG